MTTLNALRYTIAATMLFAFELVGLAAFVGCLLLWAGIIGGVR